jgi:L-ribulose-5-phosphate 4-epimerase
VAKSVRVPVAQAIAESLGGSVEFHPTNLAVQWGRTGLLDAAKQLGLV